MDKTTYFLSKISRLEKENKQLENNITKLEKELSYLETIYEKHVHQIEEMTNSTRKLNRLLQINLLVDQQVENSKMELQVENLKVEQHEDQQVENSKVEQQGENLKVEQHAD